MQENTAHDSTTVAIVLYLLLETDLKNEKKKQEKKKNGNWFLKGKYKNNNKIHTRTKNRLK